MLVPMSGKWSQGFCSQYCPKLAICDKSPSVRGPDGLGGLELWSNIILEGELIAQPSPAACRCTRGDIVKGGWGLFWGSFFYLICCQGFRRMQPPPPPAARWTAVLTPLGCKFFRFSRRSKLTQQRTNEFGLEVRREIESSRNRRPQEGV